MHWLWTRLHEPPGIAIRGSAGLLLIAWLFAAALFLAGARDLAIVVVALSLFAVLAAIGGISLRYNLSFPDWHRRPASVGTILFWVGGLGMFASLGLYVGLTRNPSADIPAPIAQIVVTLALLSFSGIVIDYLDAALEYWRGGQRIRTLAIVLAFAVLAIVSLLARRR